MEQAIAISERADRAAPEPGDSLQQPAAAGQTHRGAGRPDGDRDPARPGRVELRRVRGPDQQADSRRPTGLEHFRERRTGRRDAGPDVSARADRVLVRAAQALEHGDVALVCHGHMSRVLAVRWVGLPVVEGQLADDERGRGHGVGHLSRPELHRPRERGAVPPPGQAGDVRTESGRECPDVRIRPARAEDVDRIVELVYELAEYEKLVEECHLTGRPASGRVVRRLARAVRSRRSRRWRGGRVHPALPRTTRPGRACTGSISRISTSSPTSADPVWAKPCCSTLPRSPSDRDTPGSSGRC